MEEPILEKKNLFNRILNNQVLVTGITAILMIFVIVGSSYAIFSRNDEILESVVIKTGNLEAVLSGDEKGISLEYDTLGVSNHVGMESKGYSFKVKNTGRLPINYYEIKVVNKENEISTLPHKYINYSIKVNDGDYIKATNLGDNNSYIYTGGRLDLNEEDSFNLKLWASDLYGDALINKTANLSLEVILYSDIPTRNYIIYNLNGGVGIIPNSNILLNKVSSIIPEKDGYTFMGWSRTIDGEVVYQSGADYNETMGTTLYAIWQKNSD